MSVHIYRADDQPATRFVDQIGPHRWVTTFNPRHKLSTNCCRKQRWAKNLIAHCYYDGVYFFCRKGMGCKS